MDIKTLEYMEKRAKEAREIANRIEWLRNQLGRVKEISDISFHGSSRNHLFSVSTGFNDNRESNSRIITEISSATKKVISDEITLLEKELAEL